MAMSDSPWAGGARFARVFERVPPNDDKELRSRDICKEARAYRWRRMKRFLFPPSLLTDKPLERKTLKTYESLSLCDLSQQHLRACHSLTANHELMKYKRSLTDGRSDWVRFVEGMCYTDSTYMPFQQDAACLPPPLLPRRTDEKLEQHLALENLPKRDCVYPSHGSTIAPVHSSMWFDAEHIKNVLNGTIVRQEIRPLDGIIADCIGSATSVLHPTLLATTQRTTLYQDWYTRIQEGFIMRQTSRWDQKEPAIFKFCAGFPSAVSKMSSKLLASMDISQFVDGNHDPTPDLKVLRQILEVEPQRCERNEEPELSRISSKGTDDLISIHFQECVNIDIEVSVLHKFQREAEPVSIFKDRVFSLSNATWRLCFAAGNLWAADCIKDFCSQGLVNIKRWHQGPKDIMARCNPLHGPRRFDVISQWAHLFQKVSFSPSIEDMVGTKLHETFNQHRLGRLCNVLHKEYEHLRQSYHAEAWDAQASKLNFKDVVEPEYDPPQRRSSLALEFKIQPRGYSPTRQSLVKCSVQRGGEARHDKARNDEDLDDDEQIVPFFGVSITDMGDDDLMDIPVELTAGYGSGHLQDFENFAQTCKVSKSKDNTPRRLPSRKIPKPVLLSLEEDALKNVAKERSLKVPKRLICRPWILELAQECIRADRAAIYMPSPLSCIPSLSIVAHTLLSQIDEDFRVLIFCLGNPNMPFSVKNYFNYIFGDEYLVAVHSQSLSNDDDGGHEVQKKLEMSRILITDFANAETVQSFPLLFVLMDCGPEISDNNMAKSIDLFSTCSPCTENKKMIFVAPYRSQVSCADFHLHAHTLMKTLDVGKRILCDSAHEEITACLILSRPERLLLVPSRTASNALRIIDKTAKQILNFISKSDTSGGNLRGCAERNMLQSMTLSFLEHRIDDTLQSNDEQRQRAWMELYTLRNARSYALYDGVNAAVSFLKNAITRFGGETQQRLLGVLRGLKREGDQEQKSETKYHPVVKAIRKLLIGEQKKMKEDERAVTRLWMCQSFSPLVITESDVMMSGIINGLDSAVDHETAERGETAVCLLESLLTEGVNAESQHPFLDRYSHVFYVSMDRTGQDALGRLPPWITSAWYASGLRLVNISVDETRRAADAIEAGESWFESLRHRVVREVGNLCNKQGFITTELFCPPSHVIDVDAVMPMPITEIEMIDDIRPSQAPELRFGEVDILSFATDDDLRKTILEHVNNRQSSVAASEVTLCAQVSGSRGNAAVTRIACAIAMDEKLRRLVSVRFTFG